MICASLMSVGSFMYSFINDFLPPMFAVVLVAVVVVYDLFYDKRESVMRTLST